MVVPGILRIDPLPPCDRVDVVSDTPVGSLHCDNDYHYRNSTPVLPCATLYYWHKYTLAGTRTASTNVLLYL